MSGQNYEHEQEREQWLIECERWIEFYMTFNDNNYVHADNAFVNNGLNTASASELHQENIKWVVEILDHSTTEEELLAIMPEAKEYLAEAKACTSEKHSFCEYPEDDDYLPFGDE